MRVLKVNRFWPALAVAFGAALVIVTAASADGGRIPFYALGFATSGDTGEVDAAGQSGRYVVKDRTIVGALIDPTTGSPNGSFSFTFGTNVPLATQSGQIHGDGALNLAQADGSIRSIATSVAATATNVGACALTSPIGDPTQNFLLSISEQLEVTGGFTFTNGDQGHGDVTATVCFVRDYVYNYVVYGLVGVGEGHIALFSGGVVNLSGEWSPS